MNPPPLGVGSVKNIEYGKVTKFTKEELELLSKIVETVEE